MRQAREEFKINIDEPILNYLVESSTKRVIVVTETSIRLIDTGQRQKAADKAAGVVGRSEWSLKLASPPMADSIIVDSCGSRLYFIDRNDTVHAVGAFGGARLWSRTFPNSINTGMNGVLYHYHDFDAKLSVMLDKKIVTLSAVTGEISAEYSLLEKDDWFFGRIHRTEYGVLVASLRLVGDRRMPQLDWESQRIHHINIETGNATWISPIGRMGLVAEHMEVSGLKVAYFASGVSTAALSLDDGSILWSQKEKGKLLDFSFYQEKAEYSISGIAATSSGVAVLYNQEKKLYVKMIKETGETVWTQKGHSYDFDGRLDSEITVDAQDYLLTTVSDRDKDVTGITVFDSAGTIFADFEFRSEETSVRVVPFGSTQSSGCLAFRSGLKEIKGLCD